MSDMGWVQGDIIRQCSSRVSPATQIHFEQCSRPLLVDDFRVLSSGYAKGYYDIWGIITIAGEIRKKTETHGIAAQLLLNTPPSTYPEMVI